MDLNMIFRIAGIGIFVGFLVTLLNEAGKKEIAQFVTVAGIILVLFSILQAMSQLFALVKSVFQLY
ncbi:stage III sporulation protein AC [Acididesulfobacillus acetoxydans]|uniref:Stage III sporulation protein AC n=1 Tax=Acididesulfobacillus acetoxydans TaxID=1561005 RepID=A0A8S0W402_9FIRM|nr:stage III sporulation protein AC [Acididesulfobacillus acetoxydans]CAA7602138.1 stage III sporulation protein AC [Acididesulfobacillus acetoxydans]CEJ08019.1 spore_III_AC: stage III sporulation protein AC [Acididesulfobacillus acetoxydans]